MKVLRIGIFGRFLPEYKIHYLAIFLQNTIVTGMPYLSAKDELVSLNRLSSRGLWKWYNSKVLDRRLYGVWQHFTFWGFLEKENSLETLIVIFEKVSSKGFLWLKNFEISVLTANFRYLQTAALKALVLKKLEFDKGSSLFQAISWMNGRVHFVVFEKFTSAYLFQIAREKSCDYVY